MWSNRKCEYPIIHLGHHSQYRSSPNWKDYGINTNWSIIVTNNILLIVIIVTPGLPRDWSKLHNHKSCSKFIPVLDKVSARIQGPHPCWCRKKCISHNGHVLRAPIDPQNNNETRMVGESEMKQNKIRIEGWHDFTCRSHSISGIQKESI
jgi:hypothetical protein